MTTIFANGRYFRDGRTWSGAVGVNAGRIATVGDLADVREAAGPSADEVDLAGGLLSPGFIDAHLHPIMGGLERSQCDLGDATDADDCLRTVRRYAEQNPESAWIVGGGWPLDYFPNGTPTRELLDLVVPDRPALLRSADRHGAWVNTAALERAGIGPQTPDPKDGRIERDESGRPSGMLHEGAIALVQDIAPAPDAQALYRGLMTGQGYAFSLGITGWQDALLKVDDDGTDAIDVYLTAVENSALHAKVTGAMWWDRTRGLDQIPELIARRSRVAGSGGFRADAVKLMLDGIAENFTALLTRPYHDGHGHSTGNIGIRMLGDTDLGEVARALDAAGFQMHFHALGDLAVREALDALSTIPAGRDNRHHLAHLQIVQPHDVRRFRNAGATANIQPLWAQNETAMTELTIPFLDPALVSYIYPFERLRLAGARLAAGSDWPVSTADPLQGIHVAVNRSGSTSVGAPALLPGEALPLGAVWEAYTSGSAWINHREADTGRIEPGLAADLAIVDRDPFAGPAEEVGAASVVSTWIDGVMRWSA